MLRKIKSSLAALAVWVLPCISPAQVPAPAKSMLSPTAAQLGEYGDIPVSLFTGIPQVEIPLYELKTGGHVLPISISYHGGGVRLEQMPGWTGLGWSLHAGGCVTRIVKDLPDEYCNGGDTMRSGRMPSRFQADTMNLSSASSLALYAELNVNGHSVYYGDTEADEFRFDFLGYHGKFYWDPCSSDTTEFVAVQCDKAVRVNSTGLIDPFEGMTESASISNIDHLSAPGHSRAIRGFVITAEDGTRYTFGNDNDAIEYSVDFFNQSKSGYHATAWHLTRVSYPDGHVVTLNYEQLNENGHTTFEAQLGRSCYTWSGVSYQNNGGYELPYGQEATDTLYCYSGQLIRPAYLSSIENGMERIVLDRERYRAMYYDTHRILRPFAMGYYEGLQGGGTPLGPYVWSNYFQFLYHNSVEVDDKNGTGARPQDGDDKAEFYYSALQTYRLCDIAAYRVSDGRRLRLFEFSYLDDPGQRLMLSGLTEYGMSAGDKGRTYGFEYYSPSVLPHFLSGQTDHWGFYNGDYSSFDHIFQNASSYYGHREPTSDLPKALAGSLRQINYPTGGYTRLEYEPHDYSRRTTLSRDGFVEMPSPTRAGGLRVRRVVNKPREGGDSVVREYFYVRGYAPGLSGLPSSGVLGTNHQYYFPGYHPWQITSNSYVCNFFSSQSVIPGSENAFGCHVGYSEVVEKLGDGSYSIHRFSNFDNGYGDLPPELVTQSQHVACEPFTSRSFQRGLLLESENYRLVNGVPRLAEKRSLAYQNDSDSASSRILNLKLDGHSAIEHIGEAYVVTFKYLDGAVYRSLYYLPRKVGETVTVYDDGNSMMRKETRVSYHDYNKLPMSISTSLGGGAWRRASYQYPSPSSSRWLYDRHILTPVLLSTDERIEGTDTVALSRTMSVYESPVPRPSRILSATGDNPLEERVRYAYDARLNVCMERRDSVDDNIYLWGYGGRLLVARVQGATLEQVREAMGDLDAFTRSATPDYGRLARLRALLPHALVTTYHHEPCVGVRRVTRPTGSSVYYEYDGLGRLKNVRDDAGRITDAIQYHYQEN